jgi:hypothetical protein
VKLVPGNWTNNQQLTAPHTDPAYLAASPTLVAMVPTQLNSMQGAATLPKLATAAGTYGDASGVSYGIGLKYNKGGTNPQGQIQLVLERADGTYFVKSNSITSVGFSNPGSNGINRDVTVYTKASIYKVTGSGVLTSVDGGVTLRVDAHDGGAGLGGDTVAFTVLSTKTSALYYSNNWTYDSVTKSWRTVQQPIGHPASTPIVIG